MSFILEALKKSEQQRQEKNALQQKVRNRTLSLPSSRTDRGPYWLLAGLLPLLLLCGWWLYNETNPAMEQSPELSPVTSSPPATSQPKESEPVVISPASPASAPPQPAAAVEPAPVPIVYVTTPRADSSTAPAKGPAPAVESLRVDAPVASKMMKTDEPVVTGGIKQTEPEAMHVTPSEPLATRVPLYLDLSRELRDRMHPLAMSMHFYNTDPDRRLVRINDRLLHEGDWVNRYLELVEITPAGVLLDFEGQIFELSGARR